MGGLATKKYETEFFKVIVGCELNTTHGEIIGLFLTEEIKSKDINEAIEEIHSQGGLVIIPHPFDKFRKSSIRDIDDYVKKIDAIEAFNARCILNNSNREALEYAKEHKIPVTAGSDAHFTSEIGLAGIYASDDSKNGILNNDFKIFYNRSSLLNHMKTKMNKMLKSFGI
jgi:predicted metal-dependent phosphoesterase TrpH